VKHFLLFYDTAADYLDRRPLYRAAHLAYAQAAVERGELILGGALTNPPDRAVLLFRAESDAIARRFAESDPYVVNGLVTTWQVREWITVVGPEATVQPA
jgi:uncharacterized protein YciI